jgi:hypothetical protein
LTSDLFQNAQALIRRGHLTLDDLDELLTPLTELLPPESTILGESELGAGPNERLLIDVQIGMCIVDSSDPALAWALANTLFAMKRWSEAAFAYMCAASRFRKVAATDPMTGDEDDWAETCVEQATTCLQNAGLGLSATAISDQGR